MKLKEGFVIRQVAGQTVVLPAGDELDLNMMITLNDTGRFLWELLEQDTDIDALTAALLKEYDVDEATARVSVSRFIDKLKANEFLA